MKNILTILQIILSVVLTSLIFLQNNSSASRSNIISPIQNQKRGWEKLIFIFTLVSIGLFLISSIIQTTLV